MSTRTSVILHSGFNTTLVKVLSINSSEAAPAVDGFNTTLVKVLYIVYALVIR